MDRTLEDALKQLVETYRELNTSARPSQIPAIGEIVERMRGDELLFGVALKERILGFPSGGEGANPIIGPEDEGVDVTIPMLVSQFGTARETTLTTLRGLSGEQWSIDAGEGRTVKDRVLDLAANDLRQLAEIRSLLKQD